MKILLLTGHRTAAVADVAHAIACSRFPEHTWCRFALDAQDAAAADDLGKEVRDTELLISFLCPYIVSVSALSAVDGNAYNVHPSPPAYPGSDPMNFAFYDGYHVAGATLHLMEASVDSGPICDVVEYPVDPQIGLPAFSALCINLALALFIENLANMVRGQLSPNGLQWAKANKHSHRDFLDMCHIECSISAGELKRRLDAFYHPLLDDRPFVEVHGKRFVYDG